MVSVAQKNNKINVCVSFDVRNEDKHQMHFSHYTTAIYGHTTIFSANCQKV